MTNSSPAQSSMGARVALFTVIRSVINSAYRMAYAMQPLLATGMGVKLNDLAVALSIRSLLGTFSPFLAIFTDTQGRKKGMTLGLVLFILGVGLTATLQNFTGFIIGASLVVVGNGVFIPSMQSYLSDHVPFERRGKVLAVTELVDGFHRWRTRAGSSADTHQLDRTACRPDPHRADLAAAVLENNT